MKMQYLQKLIEESEKVKIEDCIDIPDDIHTSEEFLEWLKKDVES